MSTEIAHVIAISSGKGCVGKSTLSCNLGIALSKAGKKVCLLDADTNLASINILLGITPLQTLEHFFKQDLDLSDIIIKGPEGMDIISGASGVAYFIQLSHIQQVNLLEGIRSLERRYHYLLIDTAAGIDKTSINLLLAAPYLLLSITPDPTSLTDAFSLLRVLRKHHFNRSILVIVNMAASFQSAHEIFQRFKSATRQYLNYNVNYAGFVLSDKNIPKSISSQQPVLITEPESPASRCINKISKRLLNAFDKRPADRTSLSDHLAEAMSLKEFSQTTEQLEFIPPQETIEKPEQDKEKPANSALLRASHFARLLGGKR